MKPQYTVRKFDGDDSYSWAVFLKSDLPKGRRGTIFYGEAAPRYSGLSRSQAKYYKDSLEVRAEKKASEPKLSHCKLYNGWVIDGDSLALYRD